MRTHSKICNLYCSNRKKSYSLSNFVNNFSEGIHRIKCKFGHHNKKCEICGTEYKYCNCYLEYKNFKDDLIEYKCCFATNITNTSLTKVKGTTF